MTSSADLRRLRKAILAPLIFVAATVFAPGARAAESPAAIDLDSLSIEDLAKIEISSVSKTAQSLSEAAAAIFVITHDDIVRSGATSIPEMLRMAPNLEVFQTNAVTYTVTARGFSGNVADQSFSNKLLVLIDGRAVYTPLYSGVLWDVQNVPPDDIERIEVISGPGATLWGANAMNGVINIITRKSSDTQGLEIDASAGNLLHSETLQYGGRIGDQLTYRAYLRDFDGANTVTATGANADDRWRRPQGGARIDWTGVSDVVTVQGDAYGGTSDKGAGVVDEKVSGDNVLGRWNHSWKNGSALQVQAFYDHTERGVDQRISWVKLDTYDLDLQHSFALGPNNEIVWGGGARMTRYSFTNNAILQFIPPSRALNTVNVFVQDSIALTKTVKLVAGLKLEGDAYASAEPLPSVRLSWQPSASAMVWAAVSRAVRSATPWDRDLAEYSGKTRFLTGGSDFESEKLTAYEAGGRFQAASRISFSVSAYYNVYDDLRSVEATPVTLLPFHWDNRMSGATYGLEAWSDVQVTPWWRLSPSVNLLAERLTLAKGSSGLQGTAQAGDDPPYQVALKSSMNLGRRVTLDADLRDVGALPNPVVPAYAELNARIGWKVTDQVEFSLAGFNLLHDRHQEAPAPAGAVARSFTAGLQWRF